MRHRYGPAESELDIVCEWCSALIRKVRLKKHQETPACKVERYKKEQHIKGWLVTYNTPNHWLEEAGVPHEKGPYYHHGAGWGRTGKVINATYAPAWVAALHLVWSHEMSKSGGLVNDVALRSELKKAAKSPELQRFAIYEAILLELIIVDGLPDSVYVTWLKKCDAEILSKTKAPKRYKKLAGG